MNRANTAARPKAARGDACGHPSALSGKTLTRLLIIAVVAAGAFSISGMLRSSSSAALDAPDVAASESHNGGGCPHFGRRFGIMLDGGSTASRIHAYEFDFHENGKVDLKDELFLESKPGFQSYDDPEAAANSLVALLDAAVAVVPPERARRTPIELKATAGLRLAGPEQADAILAAVYRLLLRYPFAVSGPEAAIVMDGKDEGPYAWMTVNFLLDTMSTLPGTPPTGAIIDMGGASTQIVFRPDRDSVMGGVETEKTFRVSTEGYDAKVYTHSHLGYGLKQANIKMYQAAKEQGLAQSFPCFPAGHTATAEPKGEAKFEVATEEKAQSFDKCLALAEGILNKKKPCPTDSCSFNGVPQPGLATAFTGPVYAFSYFYDNMEPFLNAQGESSVGELRAMAEGVCGGTDPKYAAHNKQTACMDLSYLYAVLRVGYDLPDDKPLHITKKIKGYETAWCLGAMMAAMKLKA